MTEILAWLEAKASRVSRRRGLVCLVLVYLLLVGLFSWRGAWLEQHLRPAADGRAAGAFITPDARTLLAPDEVRATIKRLDRQGRRGYALSELTLDVAFPAVYALLFAAILIGLARRDGARPPRWALAMPLLMALADLAENLLFADIALTGVGFERLAALAHAAKWAFFAATLAAVGIVGRRLWTTLIEYLALIRVQLLLFGVFVLIERLGGAGGLPTIANMMGTESWRGLAAAGFAVALTVGVIGFNAIFTWRLAALRFGVAKLRLPRWLRGWSPWRMLPLVIVATPMLWRLWQAADIPRGQRIGGLVVGVGLVALAFEGIERGRRLLLARARLLAPVFRLLGPGYWANGHIVPGHGLALGLGVVLALVYALGYSWLSPVNPPRTLPAIAYVLLLITLLCSLLSGLSFFLDRFRVPLLLGLVLFAVGSSQFFPVGHHFDIAPGEATPPTIDQAARARQRVQATGGGDDLIVVVGASGGGILASAWTTQVLTGLQEALGEEFTRSIYLISSTSGGSVGAFFYLEGFDPERGAPPAERLEAIRQASMASSLEATAWGLVFPDFLRAFLPVINPTYDRAWAAEQAWLRAANCLRLGRLQRGCAASPSELPATRLSDWRRLAARGAIPGVVLNATFVGDGEQFLISNLDLGSLKTRRPRQDPPWRYGPFDPTLGEHYPQHPFFDLHAVTGARLSATFPYVTPVAKARSAEEPEPPTWHGADGGYYDNYGTVAAVQWIGEVVDRRAESGSRPRVVYLQLNAFPPSERAAPPGGEAGWIQATLGPLRTMLSVRTSSQLARNDVELLLLQRLLDERFPAAGAEDGSRLRLISFRPPPIENRPEQPLSWELSPENKRQVAEDWQAPSNQCLVEWLRREHFPERPPVIDWSGSCAAAAG